MLKFGTKVEVNGHSAIVIDSMANPIRYRCIFEKDGAAEWFSEYEVEVQVEEVRVEEGSTWESQGGAAFPIPESTKFFPETGMSLRDYFAAKVLPSVYTDFVTDDPNCFSSPDWRVGIALDCYLIADAMLSARDFKLDKKKKGNPNE